MWRMIRKTMAAKWSPKRFGLRVTTCMAGIAPLPTMDQLLDMD